MLGDILLIFILTLFLIALGIEPMTAVTLSILIDILMTVNLIYEKILNLLQEYDEDEFDIDDEGESDDY